MARAVAVFCGIRLSSRHTGEGYIVWDPADVVATTTLHLPDEHLVFSGLAPDYDPLFTLEAGDLVVYKVAAACSVASIGRA